VRARLEQAKKLQIDLVLLQRVWYSSVARMSSKPLHDMDPADESTPKLPARRRQHVWVGRALCFAGCVLAANALIGERGLSETLQARQEFRKAVSELSRLQYENAVLASQIQDLRHDSRTIESVARAELGLIKPGEVLVVVKTAARD
jgi:cell division protein FtsB